MHGGGGHCRLRSTPSIRTEGGKIVLSVTNTADVEIVDAAGTRDTVATAGMMATMSTLVAGEVGRLSSGVAASMSGVEATLSQQSSTMVDAADLIQILRTRLDGVDSELDNCEHAPLKHAPPPHLVNDPLLAHAARKRPHSSPLIQKTHHAFDLYSPFTRVKSLRRSRGT